MVRPLVRPQRGANQAGRVVEADGNGKSGLLRSASPRIFASFTFLCRLQQNPWHSSLPGPHKGESHAFLLLFLLSRRHLWAPPRPRLSSALHPSLHPRPPPRRPLIITLHVFFLCRVSVTQPAAPASQADQRDRPHIPRLSFNQARGEVRTPRAQIQARVSASARVAALHVNSRPGRWTVREALPMCACTLYSPAVPF